MATKTAKRSTPRELSPERIAEELTACLDNAVSVRVSEDRFDAKENWKLGCGDGNFFKCEVYGGNARMYEDTLQTWTIDDRNGDVVDQFIASLRERAAELSKWADAVAKKFGRSGKAVAR